METVFEYPKLRYGLEAFPVEHDGQTMVLLRDRSGLCEEPLLISPIVAELLMRMDGTNSLRDLQAYFMRRTGQLLLLERLQEILTKLNDHLFLENDAFYQRAAEEAARFLRDPVRRMQYAGKSYSADAEELRHQLNEFFNAAGGPEGSPEVARGQRKMMALVAPHIDLQAGGPCFAAAYKVLKESDYPPTTWVVLGTGHEPIENLFALSPKDFETPLGLVSHDEEFCQELIKRVPRDIRAGEYSHRREHTIEFQAVFLAFVQPRSKIVPLLCSFSLEDWDSNRDYIDETAQILREIVHSTNGRVGLIASVDLAHIGPRYGDHFQPHQGTIAEHLEADSMLLQAVGQCAPQTFIAILKREDNERKVCGLAPLYLLARILEGRAAGELLRHSQATVDAQGSFVTFASMAFYEKLIRLSP